MLDGKSFSCRNFACSDYDMVDCGNIVRASMIKTKREEHTLRWHCKTCNCTFSSTQSSFLYRLHANRNELIETVKTYLQGYTLASVADYVKRDPKTISRWLRLLTEDKEDVT